jgi:hypothetical protein
LLAIFPRGALHVLTPWSLCEINKLKQRSKQGGLQAACLLVLFSYLRKKYRSQGTIPHAAPYLGHLEVRPMTILQQDFAYTLRRLSRSRGFALAVILSIGLGIACNATIFSMVSKFVLRPAPVGDPATLLTLHTLHDGDQCCNNFPEPLFKDVRDQAKSFSGVAAYDELVPASIGAKGEPERVWGQAASANFFSVLQIPMNLGRGFLPGEEQNQVIVLSYRLWQRRFASDAAIAGKVISLSGRPYTVVGVAPAGFRGIDLILDPSFGFRSAVCQTWLRMSQIEIIATCIGCG